MGGKQSTPSTTGASSRAMGASAEDGTGTGSGEQSSGGFAAFLAEMQRPLESTARLRARSLSSVLHGGGGQPLGIPTTSQSGFATPDSDDGTPDEAAGLSRVFAAHSLPVQFVSINGIKCPVCSKFVLPHDVEFHLVMCLTKPRISYNEDVLGEDKGECVICLEELMQGDTIARLPCLCIYHKRCIDAWFEVNRSCPEHPLD